MKQPARPLPPLPWWKRAVFYQVYPRSFLDTDGDGVGDLEGIRRRLDYLAWLGIDALWISPFFRSPMKDFGYDVSDHCDVDPLFGTLGDFDRLLAEAHARGLRILVDWVPNHTSDQHPWFVDSRASRTSAKRDWYVWRDPGPDGSPPNNWVGQFFRGPAWSFDGTTGQYWLHCFLPEQPDLDWRNPEVERAMHDTLRFWLDRGVDGFRMDVVHLIGKDPAFPDDPEHLKDLTHVPLNHRPETHPLLRRIRRLLDDYPGERTAIGEVFLLDTAQIAEYYGNGDELPLCFNFLPLFTPFDAEAWREQIARIGRELATRDAWPTWVLSNHDNPRHRTRYGSEARARAAAFLLLGLRGTPFVYAGEELGLADAEIPDSRRVDPGLRDGCRAPIPWDASPSHGWLQRDNWLPWPPESSERAAFVQQHDEASMLQMYRRLLEARQASPALQQGSQELLELGPDLDRGVLALRRRSDDGDERIVVVNFGDGAARVPLEGVVDVASDARGEGRAFDGMLGGETALWLRPAKAGSRAHRPALVAATPEPAPFPFVYFETVFLAAAAPQPPPRCFAVITGCNPHGRHTSDEENAERTRALDERLQREALVAFDVTGASPDLRHREAGRGVVTGNLALAARLSAELGQLAFFWVEAGQVFVCVDASGRGWKVGRWEDRLRDADQSTTPCRKSTVQ